MNGLSEAQLEQFRGDGFLPVPGVLSDDDLAPIVAEYDRLLDDRIKPPVAGIDGDLKVHSNVGSTTWHQDIVALLPEADDTRIVTVWP